MNDEAGFQRFQEQIRARVEAALATRLPDSGNDTTRLHEAMRYACLGGGKRIRAMLVYAAGDTFEAAAPQLDVVAAAVEMVHAYSLVHDDLPAMDDDHLRRGQPTCHIAFDDATAILAGDGLQTLAFELLAADSALDLPAAQRLRMIAVLAGAAGWRGMVGGQAADMAATGRHLDLDALTRLHRRKTGALIEASVLLGGLAAQATEQELTSLSRYGENIGLAFQIVDDVLDEESDTATLGKTSGADRSQGKVTYPAAIGLARSKHLARESFESAVAALQPVGERAYRLRELASLIVRRSF